MNIAIVGCRDGVFLNEQIQKNKRTDFNVICFCDNNPKFWDKKINGIPVISVDQLAINYHNNMIEAIVVAVRKGYSRFCIVEQLRDKGIENIILVKPSPLTFRLPIIFDRDNPLYHKQWMELGNIDKPIIHHLEVHAADGCNLNCKGCLHFSNLYKKDDFPNLEVLLETIKLISEKCEIFQLRVLGGEPLLNPKLDLFLERLRKILPDTDIAVISNGILIPKVSEKIFCIMRDNYIGFNLTLYLPTLKVKDKIYKTLNRHHVPYGSHEIKTDSFERFMSLEPFEDGQKPFQFCVPRGILIVKDQKIFKCPIEAYIGKYYEKFHIALEAPKGINLIENRELDWDKLIYHLYKNPGEICRYCSAVSEFYKWGNGRPKKEDWLISNIEKGEE